MVKIGIIGTGYWGKHYLRILTRLPCQLSGIADIDPEKEKLAAQYNVAFYSDYRKLIKKSDAVAIVTPPVTHYPIAKKALKKGKHVLLEKPFVFRIQEVKELKKIAEKNRLVLMVGHTYLYHPAILRIKELLKNGELGKIYYLLLQWLNLGIIRRDVNALWNFAPHPFSILYFLFEKLPVKICVSGQSFIQKGIEDVVFATLYYPEGIMAQVNLSWLHPLKIREVTIVGSKKLVHFDEAKNKEPLQIFDKGVAPEEFNHYQNWEDYAQFKAKSVYGTLVVPKLEEVEPLENGLRDFLEAVEKDRKPRADVDSAEKIVFLLNAAAKSLKKGGKEIYLEEN